MESKQLLCNAFFCPTTTIRDFWWVVRCLCIMHHHLVNLSFLDWYVHYLVIRCERNWFCSIMIVKSCWLNHVQISGLSYRLSPARSTYVYGVNIMSSSQKINKLFKWIKINFNKQGSFSYLWCSLGICFPLIEKQMPVVLILDQHFWYYILSWSAYICKCKKSRVFCSTCTCVCPVYLAAMHLYLYSRMCSFASSCLKRYSEN